jgi:SAM-dependent methyltransferase
VKPSFEERRLRWLAAQFARPSGWAGQWLIGPWLDHISRAMNRRTLELLDLEPQDRVLEVGFGGGDLLGLMLALEPAEVIGADISEAMVARARRRFRGERKLSLFQASVDALPLPDGALDKACSVNNLYFWPDPQAALAELARVLRPGGRLVIAFEPPEELRKWRGSRFGFRLCAPDQVAALAGEAGFGRIELVWGSGRTPDRFCCLSASRLGANG